MSLDSSMDKVLERRREVEDRLSDSANMSNSDLAQFSRELSDLRPVCEQIELVRRIEAELADALVMVEEAKDDPDMLEMAQAEADSLKAQLPEAQAALQLLLLPKDKDDSRNAILEVRAGTGGDEAALFAANLFSMYQRYAAKHGWKFEVMEVSETGIGGYKEATATISGNDVFARLKFESGVHRVQRVPSGCFCRGSRRSLPPLWPLACRPRFLCSICCARRRGLAPPPHWRGARRLLRRNFPARPEPGPSACLAPHSASVWLSGPVLPVC